MMKKYSTIKVMENWIVVNEKNDDDEKFKDHHNKAYSLKYETLPIEFPIYFNTANTMMDSFELEDIDD